MFEAVGKEKKKALLIKAPLTDSIVTMAISLRAVPCLASCQTRREKHACTSVKLFVPSIRTQRNCSSPAVCLLRAAGRECRRALPTNRTSVRCSAVAEFSPNTTHIGLLGAGIMGGPMVRHSPSPPPLSGHPGKTLGLLAQSTLRKEEENHEAGELERSGDIRDGV